MPTPRSKQICLQATPYYHCVSRCVRRAFLCGKDKVTNTCYEHRRGWIEQRLLFLANVFCIDICAYAVMSNHVHVVLHINHDKVKSLTDSEVINRWHKVCKGTLLTQQFAKGDDIHQSLIPTLTSTIEIYRQRLFDISWFMRLLNEPIARQANAEDNCTGRFWEGRFTSQALLDEAALAACMAYVDLNPVRAGIAKTPEQSMHTSIRLRVKAAIKGEQPKALMPFVGDPRKDMPNGLPFKLDEYIQLVDLTGRVIRDDKAGHIENTLPTIINRLNISPESWLRLTTEFEKQFKGAVGQQASIEQFSELQQRRRQNLTSSQQIFG
ncbi:transposase [Thalassotalea agarivorans]|uniref:Transposase IS200-like domain-containing protein n=1 Tax=Thalassotalea agarivorans TaxID=349064 RepID=A0A1I0ELR0_THASX|nr:transposase [Thalassotalea agarivorans]SET46327.1 hypothetical protein SAMN05660429_01851 [Thalassotalea agarivorans]